MNQAERVSDFLSRIDYSPDSVYSHQERDWRYIPIHPFADEPSILDRLDLTPADCMSADAYWEIDGDIVFLEIISAAQTNREKGLYCRTRTEGGNVAFAVLTDDSVTRSEFERVMARFYDSGRLFDSFPDALTKIESEQQHRTTGHDRPLAGRAGSAVDQRTMDRHSLP